MQSRPVIQTKGKGEDSGGLNKSDAPGTHLWIHLGELSVGGICNFGLLLVQHVPGLIPDGQAMYLYFVRSS